MKIHLLIWLVDEKVNFEPWLLSRKQARIHNSSVMVPLRRDAMDSVELEADLDLMFAPQESCLLGSRPSQRWRDTAGDTAAVRLRERAVPRSSSPPAPPPRPPPLPRSADTETPPPEFPVPPPTPDPFSPQRHKAVGDMSIVVFQGGCLSISSIRVLVGQLTSH